MSVGSDNKKSPACPSGGGGSQLCPLGTSQDSLHGFMQQQSRIFVFSTAMANKAAEAVKQGKCPNMITYHMEHPLTKQFLQVSPKVYVACVLLVVNRVYFFTTIYALSILRQHTPSLFQNSKVVV